MKYILVITIFLIHANIFADPDKQPSIDSTKYFVVDGDTLSVYLFWKAHYLDFSLIRSESKITIKSKDWKGGDFFLVRNKEKNKIILKEVINPWGPDEEILNQLETDEVRLKIGDIRELGYWNNKIWFASDSLNKESELWSPPDIIGFFDIRTGKSKFYYSSEYYPKEWDIYKSLNWTFYYKGRVIFYMDNSFYGNPTKNMKILEYDGNFKKIEIE